MKIFQAQRYNASKYFANFLNLNVEYFFPSVILCSSSIRTIHLSPHGRDILSCGSQLLKCKSIDYAMEQFATINKSVVATMPITSLRLVLENHPKGHTRYLVGKKTHMLPGNLTSVHIMKEKPHQHFSHPNPVIYNVDIWQTSKRERNPLFVFSNSAGQSPKVEIDLQFVDLTNVELIRQPPAKIFLLLQSLTIRVESEGSKILDIYLYIWFKDYFLQLYFAGNAIIWCYPTGGCQWSFDSKRRRDTRRNAKL